VSGVTDDVPARTTAADRDEVIDLLRSVATTTVVVWHWVFTILVWRSDGPEACEETEHHGHRPRVLVGGT
jgi:hypothetical protein